MAIKETDLNAVEYTKPKAWAFFSAMRGVWVVMAQRGDERERFSPAEVWICEDRAEAQAIAKYLAGCDSARQAAWEANS